MDWTSWASWSPALQWAVVLTLGLLVVAALPPLRLFDPPAHYLPLHTALEVLSVVVSGMVLGLAFSLRGDDASVAGHDRLLGAAFGAVGLLDLLHLLSYPGMPELVTPSGAEKSINFWLVARALGAAGLLVVAFSRPRHWSSGALWAVCLLPPALVAWPGLVHPDAWPRTFSVEQGLTPFKIGAEWLISAAYAAAAVRLLVQYQRTGSVRAQWLGAAAWVQALSELYFTLYTDVTDTHNLAGHAYKAVAFWMVYRGLFVAGVQAPQAELARERALLKTLVSVLPDPVWIKDREGVYQIGNAAFERLTGVGQDRRVGRIDADFLPHNMAQRFRDHDLRTMAAATAVREEVWLQFPGEPALGLFSVVKVPIPDEHGQPVGVLGVAHDVSGERRLQATLRQRIRELDALYGIFTLTEDLNAPLGLQLQSVAARLALAWAEEERPQVAIRLEGHSVGDTGDADADADADAEADAQCRAMRADIVSAGRLLGMIELRWPQPERRQVSRGDGGDGSTASQSLDLVQAVAVRLAGLVEQRHMLLRLRESEQHFRNVANAGPVLIWTANLREGCDYVNEPWLRFTGRRLEDETGRGWMDRLRPGDRERILGIILPAMAARRPFGMDFELRRWDGAWRWFRNEASPCFDSAGRHAGYAGYCIDITPQKEATLALATAQERLEARVQARTRELAEAKNAAEAANVAKSRFLANMSHEIRTPLNAIIGLAHLVRRSGVTPQQATRLRKIDTAGEHLLSTLSAVLDLSKIEAGKLLLEQAPLDVPGLVGNVVNMLSDGARSKRLNLNHVVGGMPAGLQGDAMRLQQALLNLAANALKFTDTGSVTVRAMVQTQTEASVLLRFEVQDTGCGIAPEVLGRLFTPFEQADASTTRQHGGTGLGLALTRRLALLMAGDAGATSVPGQGSTFWFTAHVVRPLPLPSPGALEALVEPAAAVALLPQADAEHRLRQRHVGRRVLVVEDDAVNREVTAMLLRDAGLVVSLATDGEQALQLGEQQLFDLVLMDMQMPRLDGLAATWRWRARLDRGQRTPIVALTANAFADDKQQCLAAGMDDFLAKPVDPERLFQVVLHWLDHGTSAPGAGAAQGQSTRAGP